MDCAGRCVPLAHDGSLSRARPAPRPWQAGHGPGLPGSEPWSRLGQAGQPAVQVLNSPGLDAQQLFADGGGDFADAVSRG